MSTTYDPFEKGPSIPQKLAAGALPPPKDDFKAILKNALDEMTRDVQAILQAPYNYGRAAGHRGRLGADLMRVYYDMKLEQIDAMDRVKVEMNEHKGTRLTLVLPKHKHTGRVVLALCEIGMTSKTDKTTGEVTLVGELAPPSEV